MNYKARILAVDDNDLVHVLLKQVLKSPDREIITAKNGYEAIDILKHTDDISLILLDIQMPGIDGFETARQIKDNIKTKDIPIIFITGIFKSEEFVNQGFNLGAYDYIQKPFDSNVLINKVNVFLTLYNQEKILKKQTEELNIILRSITDGVITISAEGKIIYANNSAESILDYTPGELKGKNISDVIFNIDNVDNKLLFNSYDWTRATVNSEKMEFTISTNKGKHKIITTEADELKDETGNFIGAVLVFSDVTEIVRTRNQRALSQKMESVGQLASGIAHEINTPMQFIGDNTFFIKDAFSNLIQYNDKIEEFFTKQCESTKNPEILEKINDLKSEFDFDYLKEEIPVAIERTQSGIDRVSKIVLAMKNFAHPSGKQKTLSNINQGIDVTVTISRNEWKYIAALETELDPNLPLVLCTLDEINQVILNMIINAAHALEDVVSKDSAEKGKIKIITKYDEKFVYIIISDTGKGIPKENLTRIFDPFFTTKEVGKGTGQGLAIAHNIIVNKHSGEIQVESEPGQGTTFTIKLPLITDNTEKMS